MYMHAELTETQAQIAKIEIAAVRHVSHRRKTIHSYYAAYLSVAWMHCYALSICSRT